MKLRRFLWLLVAVTGVALGGLVGLPARRPRSARRVTRPWGRWSPPAVPRPGLP